MLNELLEYEQYTYVFKSDLDQNYKRLKHGTLTNQLSGIERAMKIIAAYYLYKDDSQPLEAQRKTAKYALGFWCGIPTAEMLDHKKEFAEINLWLLKYINSVFIKIKVLELCNTIIRNSLIKDSKKQKLCDEPDRRTDPDGEQAQEVVRLPEIRRQCIPAERDR